MNQHIQNEIDSKELKKKLKNMKKSMIQKTLILLQNDLKNVIEEENSSQIEKTTNIEEANKSKIKKETEIVDESQTNLKSKSKLTEEEEEKEENKLKKNKMKMI